MHTPAKGSPVFRRTKRMSPTLAASGLVREKREVRAPVGSRREIWEDVRSLMGSLNLEAGEAGGAMALIFRRTVV